MMLLHSKEKAIHGIAAAKHSHRLRLFKVPANQQSKYTGDEVTINGNLYDVGEREIISDTLYISLYHDADEQGVLSVITDFFKADDASAVSAFPDRPSLKNIRIVFNPQYYFDVASFSLKAFGGCYKNYPDNISQLSIPAYDIITPPPRLS